jgi:DNA-binding winged helix-turn-helix (wHTH) protein
MTIYFDPFRVDLADEQLWCGAQALHLTRKAWEALQVLVEARGHLVTKDRLAATVWHGTHVGDDSIAKVIRELRRVLGDDQRAPHFIATVHGRGYRFIAPLSGRATEPAAQPASPPVAPGLIGRDREMVVLQSWLEHARQGQRRVGVVCGEIGIGKSTLLRCFLESAKRDHAATVLVAGGHCVEQYGGAEPFLPVISALRRLARTPAAAAILQRASPPWLATACGLAAPGRTDQAVTRAGVLRTLAEVIEAIANEATLVFGIGDLQWSDPSTLDLVNLLARRTDPTRLLVLCTLRQADSVAAAHPSALLRRELRRTGLCREIVLDGLSAADVDRYLAARLAGGEPPAGAAAYLLRYTDGNPFFLGALIDNLLACGALARERERWVLDADDIPPIPKDSLAALAPRLERLTHSERTILEAATVVGDSFSAETVAVIAAERDDSTELEAVEAICERLVQHDDILRAGSEGTPYAFRHVLYRQALYDGIAPARRRRMHARLGESLAAERPAGSCERAAELARHFSRAGDHPQAARYHTEAAEAARARFADREAAAHLGTALEHLRACPQTPERDVRELMLIRRYAAAMLVVNGVDDPAAAAAYRREQSLARRLHMPLVEFAASAGLFFLHLMRAELGAAAAIAAELVAIAPSLPLPECEAAAEAATGTILFSRGDLIGAKRHLADLRGCFPRRDANAALDPTVWHLGILGLVHAGLGDIAAARATAADLLACTAGAPPSDIGGACVLAAGIEAELRDAPRALEYAQRGAAIAAEYGLQALVSAAGHIHGWAIAATGDPARGLQVLAAGEAALRATGQRWGFAFLAVLRAETFLCAGDCAAAEAAIHAGLEHARATGEHHQDTALHRLRAECLRRTGRMTQSATALQAALEIATAQGARLGELRAAIERVRIDQATGLISDAESRLAAVCASFDAGTPLAELSIAERLLRNGRPTARNGGHTLGRALA